MWNVINELFHFKKEQTKEYNWKKRKKRILKHIILINRLSVILDNWILLFQNEDVKSHTYNYQSFIYRYWLQYETLHSKINADIPKKIFIKNNSTLTIEWENLKSKHNIK